MCTWNYSVSGHVQTACKSRGVSHCQTPAPKYRSPAQAGKKGSSAAPDHRGGSFSVLEKAGLWNGGFPLGEDLVVSLMHQLEVLSCTSHGSGGEVEAWNSS